MAASFGSTGGSLVALDPSIAEFARDVRDGLRKTHKELPPKYFYDAVGSALFDVITLLPEYGVTRAEERIIRKYAREMEWRLASFTDVVELGSGSGRKTLPILEAIARRQPCLTYCAIDVSAAALASCRRQLDGLSGVRIRSLQQSYVEGLRQFGRDRTASSRVLVLFLGSSIGNFQPQETVVFLRQVRECLRPGDALLLGTDLIQSPGRLLAAYDDPSGVTAAFNLNVLARIDRELDADFQLRNFRHEARWSPAPARIEMHLVSRTSQVVTIAGAGCQISFAEGETIWTESSHKFDPAEMPRLAERTGFVSLAQWTDREWPFAENLWTAAG
ncbi:MAG TPA: L-histidine N(alpha)-methyltransferase [Bryobacteraceae bacterium]|nr:L-histidine N(alpha)-methyltransferase [Bryobacteraceae bacterium]